MHCFRVLSVLALVGICSAAPAPSSHVLHEKRESHSARWVKRDRVTPSAVLPMRIGLKQTDLDNADQHLWDVSHPDSPNYGKHWTPEQVIEAFAPSDETVETVRAWLVASGIDASRVTHSDNKGWFAFHATAEEAEALLHTEYHEYEDSVSGGVMPACDGYHVPKNIQEHIDYITPGIKLVAPSQPFSIEGDSLSKRWTGGGGRPKPPAKFWSPSEWWPMPTQANLSNCDQVITPACVAALYQIPPTGKHPNPSNQMGIYESEAEYYAQSDLDRFFANFTPYIPQGTHPNYDSIDGAPGPTTNASADGGEVMLDLELAYPIVYPQAITIFQEDDANYENEANDTYTFGFNTFLDAIDGSYCTYSAYGETGDASIDPQYPDPAPGGYKGQLQCGVYKPTNVISVSYGGQEADVPVNYQKRQCNEFLKLGLQGISIFFASGDSGIGNYPTPYGDDGPTGCLGPNYDIFNPTWPGTCPWLTSVGATKVYPGHTVFEPESAVYDPAGHPYLVNYSSGGGFSNIYPAPDYQKAALGTYFSQHNPPYKYYEGFINNTDQIAILGANGGLYNRGGRGLPDVAANGDNTAVYTGGKFGLSGGTSAATPIFASIINRINEERLAIGKGRVGFINPVIYQNPWIFNDITNGSNPACNEGGFSAVRGWDPVTGLGTPNYPRMLALFLSLP